MFRRHQVLLIVVSLFACIGAIGVVGAGSLVAQGSWKNQEQIEPGASGFVNGTSRIMVYQTQVGVDPSAYLLTPSAGHEWVVALLDFTNFGTVPQSISMGDFRLIPSQDASAVTSDTSQGPSARLGYVDVQPDGSATVPVDSTIRVAIAFAIPEQTVADFNPTLGYGDEEARVASTVVEEIESGILANAQPWSGVQAAVQTVPGNGVIEVSIAGAVQNISLAGVTTPPADGCFGAESSAAITTLSGGNVWIEDDPTSDGSLVWYWDGARGHLILLNQALVEQGFAGFNPAYDGTGYAPWLTAASEAAEDAGSGLWDVCKGVDGEWINPPTPAPVPTKTADEVRAEYVWVDVRDLVIRPVAFEGDKIALQGEVFNIPPGQSAGMFQMQVWVTTPTGATEAVFVVFFGDATGIYEGTWVTIYGVGDGYVTGTNAFGGEIVQPLVRADIVDR